VQARRPPPELPQMTCLFDLAIATRMNLGLVSSEHIVWVTYPLRSTSVWVVFKRPSGLRSTPNSLRELKIPNDRPPGCTCCSHVKNFRLFDATFWPSQRFPLRSRVPEPSPDPLRNQTRSSSARSDRTTKTFFTSLLKCPRFRTGKRIQFPTKRRLRLSSESGT
jgi:hypothetical protein